MKLNNAFLHIGLVLGFYELSDFSQLSSDSASDRVGGFNLTAIL